MEIKKELLLTDEEAMERIKKLKLDDDSENSESRESLMILNIF